MQFKQHQLILSLLGLLAGSVLLFYLAQWTFFAPPPVDYSTQIKPILNKKCITCHGGVKKNGGFSLLFEEEAKGPTDSGHPAIIPGKPHRSEFIKRITSKDPNYRMPPEGTELTDEEIDLLTRWVKEGAVWGEHWAFVAPQPVAPPVVEVAQGTVSNFQPSTWIKNDIDRFVLARLQQEQLQPSPQADCATLLRRVSLDLIGLPPTPEQVEQFCKNPSDEKYAAFVDALLASPQYGERWAAMWLDLARYADTKGYERDVHREIWRYRDWVIRAFNADMPFDQFTIEQLAGDLLPDPTPEQYTATAFHRNTMNNDEGGTDNEEYRVMAVLDRVNTTWDVWQATTISCVQCHSHPYDPFRHEDYYKSYAFFNSTRDEDVFEETPRYNFLQAADSTKLEEVKAWITQHTNNPAAANAFDRFIHIAEPKIHPHHFDSLKNAAHADTKFLQIRSGGSARLPNAPVDEELLVNFLSVWDDGRLEIYQDKVGGKLVGSLPVKKGTTGYVRFPLAASFKKGESPTLYFSFQSKNENAAATLNWILFKQPEPGASTENYTLIQQKVLDLLNVKGETVPIMLDGQGWFHRKTHVFERGNWLSRGAEVQPGVPSSLPPLPDDAPQNRLGFAQWLVSKENPLTARVYVNRIWEQLFGIGIVETVEDFGTQGELPSHPELLDWLAIQFMNEQAWSTKQLLRQVVLSATYRQSSKVSPQLAELDPRNRLLARGPRIRLTAEQVRDQALAVSGLLSDSMYGKPVMPPQPEGIWQTVYNGAKWIESTGENRYRRAIYTYWKRTSPYPSMMAFDMPSREFCLPRRLATNTPLQALVTLNDPVYVEAALHLAKQLPIGSGKNTLAQLYQRAIFEQPSAQTLATLQEIYETAKAHFEVEPEAVHQLFAQAADSPNPDVNLAALTVVANTVMNLDAFLTKS